MFVLGLDAGGSKTVCQVADASGAVLNEVRGPGANLTSLGESGVESVLRELIRNALDGLSGETGAVCLGMAGADQPRESGVVRGVLANIAPGAKTVVVNDALIALEAGAPGAPGIVVASGTGSIAYGRDANGRAARAGGWGYLLADEGSGFWIGRDALRGVVKALDRRGPATALTPIVLATLGVPRPQDVAREVYRGGVKPAKIAALATHVHTAAEAGDAVARQILDRAALELSFLAEAVADRLSLKEMSIVLSGGTFRAAPRLIAGFTEHLAERLPGATVRVLDVEPAQGAVRLALALARGELRVPRYVD